MKASTLPHKIFVPPKTNVRGSAMLMVLFILIVLMLLGTALLNILNSSSETIAQEVIGTRALAAANSGAQAHMQKLFPLDSTSSCPADTEYDFSSINGLNSCKANASCVLYATVGGENFYRVTSTGNCGSGVIASDSKNVVISSRTVQVEARSLQ